MGGTNAQIAKVSINLFHFRFWLEKGETCPGLATRGRLRSVYRVVTAIPTCSCENLLYYSLQSLFLNVGFNVELEDLRVTLYFKCIYLLILENL